MNRAGFFALLLAASPVLPAEDDAAAEARAAAEVAAEPVEVGGVFDLEVTVEVPEGAEAAPLFDAALGDFRVLGASSGERGPEQLPGTLRFRLRLGAFVLPGDHEIPPVPIGIRTADGSLAEIQTPAVPVRVVSALPPGERDAASDIHDIRGPFPLEVSPRWRWIGFAALVLAALAAAAWFLVRRRMRRDAPAVPPAPPTAEAEAALARLSASGLLEAGDVVGFYARLAGIMKRYAGRRFETAWSERTTGEMLAELGARVPFDQSPALPLLAGLLTEADLAKFSDRPFREDAARSRFVEAGVFLDRTRPAVLADLAADRTAPPSEKGSRSA